jgi:hypothetical protein
MKNKCLWFMLLCLAVALPACSNHRWDKQAVKESEARGNKIVAAIESYKKDKAHYPTDLEELVPTYIAKIEPPVAGNGVWKYRLYENGAVFELTFEDDSDYKPSCFYRSDEGTWYLDTR